MSEQPRWRAPSVPSIHGFDVEQRLQNLVAALEAQQRGIRDLERYLGALHQDVYFGPLSGAYFAIALGRSSATGTALPTGTVDQFVWDGEMRPVQVSLVCYGGNLTVDILSESSSILSAGAVALTAATAQSLNLRGDFTVDKVKSDLTLSITSIDSGTPIHVRGSIWAKNVSKVEPA